MSENWNQGYFTDVGYTYGYYREINPVFQRFCLLLRGYASLDSATPQHCELGFGQGVSVNIHAAASPGEYVATDFNPGHAAHANTLAEAAGSSARLYDASFEQLLNRTDLQQFDSISLHGIWTWISRDNQKIIAEFAHRYLKPGGVLYISYNCFPGWSPSYPLRQLFSLHDRFAAHASDAGERVESALKFSEALLAAQPLYAKAVPQLNAKLETIKGQNRNYLAHEYLNREWNCMYFTDVVDALAGSKLEFATSAVPLDMVDAINIATEGQAFLQSIEHPVMREQARDYFVNQQFRKDIFVRGATRLSAGEQRERILDTRVVLTCLSIAIGLKVNGVLGEATMQAHIYEPLVELLATEDYRPKTVRELAAALPAVNMLSLLQAVAVMLGKDELAPCQSEAVQAQVQARCAALNVHLCQRSRFGNDIEVLASPVTGGGVVVGRFNQLFLLAIGQGKTLPAEWAGFAWQLLAEQGQRLIKEGSQLQTPEENLAELTLQAQQFAGEQLVVLKALGVA